MAELIGRLRPGSRPLSSASTGRPVVGRGGGPAGGPRSCLGAHASPSRRPAPSWPSSLVVGPATSTTGVSGSSPCSRSGWSRPALRRVVGPRDRLRGERPAVARPVPGHGRRGRPGAAALPRAGPDPAGVPGGRGRLRAGPADGAADGSAGRDVRLRRLPRRRRRERRSASASASRFRTARCGGCCCTAWCRSRIYGILQRLLRLPPWDQAWIDSTKFNSIGTGGDLSEVRVFGTLNSPGTLAALLGLSLLCYLTVHRARAGTIAAAVILWVAFALTSVRSAWVAIIVAGARPRDRLQGPERPPRAGHGRGRRPDDPRPRPGELDRAERCWTASRASPTARTPPGSPARTRSPRRCPRPRRRRSGMGSAAPASPRS